MNLETVVLGCILQDQSIHDIVIPELREEYFGKNRDVFTIIKDLYSKSQPIDLYTVMAKLPMGFSRLSEMSNSVASSANVLTYVENIKHDYLRIKLMSIFGVELTINDDPYDYLEEKIALLTSIHEGSVIKSNRSLTEILTEALDMIDRRRNHPEECFGCPTPISKLNNMTSGWQGGDLIVFAGRPGMGKTAFLLHNIRTACEYGKRVAVFSLEMRDVQLIERLIWSFGEIPEEAAGLISRWKLEIIEKGGIGLDYIKSIARILKRNGGLDMLAIDYLGLMEMPAAETRTMQIGCVTRALKALAKELNIPVVLLCQLNRAIESRSNIKHKLSDLRESGEIEQDADIVLFISRPEKFGLKEIDGVTTENMTLLQLEKHRNGTTGDILVRNNEKVNYYYDWNYEPDRNYQDNFNKILGEKPF